MKIVKEDNFQFFASFLSEKLFIYTVLIEPSVGQIFYFKIFFLFIYVDLLTNALQSIGNLTPDEISLFYSVKYAKDFNSDITKINHWAYYWEVLFNPDDNKEASEEYFSRKHTQNFIHQSTWIIIRYCLFLNFETAGQNNNEILQDN